MRETFTFVEASVLVSKLLTWSDHDKAIAEGLISIEFVVILLRLISLLKAC